jgi:hypothetical protein
MEIMRSGAERRARTAPGNPEKHANEPTSRARTAIDTTGERVIAGMDSPEQIDIFSTIIGCQPLLSALLLDRIERRLGLVCSWPAHPSP